MIPDHATDGSGLTAFFGTRAEAEQALERLRAAGFAEQSLRLTERVDPSDGAEDTVGRRAFAALGEFFRPGRDGDADGCLVSVLDVPANRRDMAARLLHEAGGVKIDDDAQGDRAASEPEARPVQPGFADASPGFVPKTAPFPETRTSGERQEPDEVAETKGRFAGQLDRLPPSPGQDPDARDRTE